MNNVNVIVNLNVEKRILTLNVFLYPIASRELGQVRYQSYLAFVCAHSAARPCGHTKIGPYLVYKLPYSRAGSCIVQLEAHENKYICSSSVYISFIVVLPVAVYIW